MPHCRGDSPITWSRRDDCRSAPSLCGAGDVDFALKFSMVPRCGPHGKCDAYFLKRVRPDLSHWVFRPHSVDFITWEFYTPMIDAAMLRSQPVIKGM